MDERRRYRERSYIATAAAPTLGSGARITPGTHT